MINAIRLKIENLFTYLRSKRCTWQLINLLCLESLDALSKQHTNSHCQRLCMNTTWTTAVQSHQKPCTSSLNKTGIHRPSQQQNNHNRCGEQDLRGKSELLRGNKTRQKANKSGKRINQHLEWQIALRTCILYIVTAMNLWSFSYKPNSISPFYVYACHSAITPNDLLHIVIIIGKNVNDASGDVPSPADRDTRSICILQPNFPLKHYSHQPTYYSEQLSGLQ